MSYLEQFLEDYYYNIDNYNALIYILSLLPNSYQYQFTKNLLKYDDYISEGDVKKGEGIEGLIVIENDEIILKSPDLENASAVLLTLPESWDF